MSVMLYSSFTWQSPRQPGMGEGSGVDRWRRLRGVILACVLILTSLSPVTAQRPAACACDPEGPTPPIPPSYVIKGVPLVGQWWNLSCEFAATAAATGYYGAPVSQQTLLNEIGYDPNPHRGFRGRITGPWGGTQDYGVYAEPIAETLRGYGFAGSYVFYGGEEELRGAVADGHPVVAWVTGTWRASVRYVQTYDGERYSLIPYEHAVTVYAYDEEGVWVMDPTYPAKYEVDWETFRFAWSQFDGMALVVAR